MRMPFCPMHKNDCSGWDPVDWKLRVSSSIVGCLGPQNSFRLLTITCVVVTSLLKIREKNKKKAQSWNGKSSDEIAPFLADETNQRDHDIEQNDTSHGRGPSHGDTLSNGMEKPLDRREVPQENNVFIGRTAHVHQQ